MRVESKPHITAIAGDAERGMYRFTIPIRTLIESGYLTGTVSIGLSNTAKLTPGSPILVQSPIALAPSVIAAAKDNHCCLVHDVDDPQFLSADDKTFDRQLRQADLITVTTEPFAEALRKRGHAPNLLPTTIDPRDWSVQPRRAPRERLRVGWRAPRSVHPDEVVLLAHTVQTLINEVDFVFLGHVPDALADPSRRIERQATVPLAFFPALFAALDLDIVLAPLAKTPVNECRSNLPLLQAGMLGYAVLSTDIEPYRALPVTLLPNNQEAWIAAIRDRVHAADGVRHEGEALRQAVHAGFQIGSAAQQYLALWTGASSAAARG